jgi:hypothetical protein
MTINMMKLKFDNYLTTHLDLVVKMYVQQFNKLDTFQFHIIIDEWGRKNSTMEASTWLEKWHSS